MKKGKRLLALIAGLLISTTAVMGFAACGEETNNPGNNPGNTPGNTPGDNQGNKPGDNPGDNPGNIPSVDVSGTYDVTIWNSETPGVSELTQAQVDRFNAENGMGIVINATIEGVGEGDAATQMITDVEGGADLFFFAQDQTMRLVEAGALTTLGNAATKTVLERSDASAIAAATVGEKLVCYPLTSDNGYFMYYDTSVIDAQHIDSLEEIIADCEAAGRNFSYELEGSAWYNAGFFFATGCYSEWTTNDSGEFESVSDNFNSDAGVIALRGMQKILQSSAYVNSSDGADFAAGTPSAVVISGTWNSAKVQEILGENYGVADLPSFTVDNKSYHIGSFSGNKLLGVKPQTNAIRAAVLQQLALFLTGEECQLERFNEFGWGPSDINAQATDDVKENPALVALAQQSAYAVPQGQIHGSWWDIAKVYATSAKQATRDSVEELKVILQTYEDSMNALFNMTDEEKNALSVIGALMGTEWNADFPMVKKADGWYSAPLLFNDGSEFKIRKGASWDWDTGAVIDGAEGYEQLAEGNAKVTAGGLYIVKYSETVGAIELIPVEFGVVGTINNWGGDGADTAMTKVDEEIAFISEAIDFAAGAEIKVRYNNTWDLGDIGNAEGGNVKVEAAGSKKVKVAWDSEKLTWVLSLVD